MPKQTVGIAGAGIIGRLVALALRQQGHQVTIFDQDPASSSQCCGTATDHSQRSSARLSACSYTAAGMLTPYSEADTADPMVVDLGLASLQLWPTIIKNLGIDAHYHTDGTLVLTHQQDRADFNRFQRLLHANLPASNGNVQSINQETLSNLEPELGERFQQALYMPNEAWLCSNCTMSALYKTLSVQGVTWHSQTRVLTTKPYEIVTTANNSETTHTFDWVIDSRGLGARKQQKNLRGVRGEIIWIRAPEVNINRLIRLMHPRYRIYIVPRHDNLYLIGATQIESEDTGPISVRSSLELLSAAYSVHPGFGEGQIVRSDVNLRPALPNNQPQVSYEPGWISVNGLFRHGYLMSPAIAQEVSAAINASGEYQSSYSNLFHYQPIDEAIT